MLFEFQLHDNAENTIERERILRAMEDTSDRAMTFAKASYGDPNNYPYEILSPYLPYSLWQAGIIQYRLWKLNGDPAYKQHLDIIMNMLKDFGTRWMVAGTSSLHGRRRS
jgi:hypothetical protein